MVHGGRGLDPVHRHLPRLVDAAGVVDEDVETIDAGAHGVRERRTDACDAKSPRRYETSFEPLRVATSARAASVLAWFRPDHDHACALTGEGDGRLRPDTAGRARENQSSCRECPRPRASSRCRHSTGIESRHIPGPVSKEGMDEALSERRRRVPWAPPWAFCRHRGRHADARPAVLRAHQERAKPRWSRSTSRRPRSSWPW